MSNVIRLKTLRNRTRPVSPTHKAVDGGSWHHDDAASSDIPVGTRLQTKREKLIQSLRNLYLGIDLLTLAVNELSMTNPDLVVGTERALGELASVKLRIGRLRMHLEADAAGNSAPAGPPG
jgi:hypothetical protein